MGALLAWTRDRFATVGIATARLDAEHLLAHALGCRRVDLYVRHDMLVQPDERAVFREVVRRRLAREPVAYIEGRRGFHALDLELAVDRRVLVPRPETELLVDWVIEELGEAPVVLDVGTGSGAIALSIKRARPDAEVIASDVSSEALAVARGNAERLALDVGFVHADVYEGLALPRPPKVIVSNPPYVARDVLPTLSPEVSRWEPALALDGGPHGLDVLHRLVAGAPGILAAGGALYVEIGEDQRDAVVDAMTAAGLHGVEARRDLAGRWRTVRGRVP